MRKMTTLEQDGEDSEEPGGHEKQSHSEGMHAQPRHGNSHGDKPRHVNFMCVPAQQTRMRAGGANRAKRDV